MYNNINRTHHASDFHAQPGGTFSFMECFMYQYPKQILTIKQLVKAAFILALGYDNNVVKEIKKTKNNCILIKVRTGFHLFVKFGSFVYCPYKTSEIGNNNI